MSQLLLKMSEKFYYKRLIISSIDVHIILNFFSVSFYVNRLNIDIKGCTVICLSDIHTSSVSSNWTKNKNLIFVKMRSMFLTSISRP